MGIGWAAVVLVLVVSACGTSAGSGAGRVVGNPIKVGSRPNNIAVGEGGVWVTNGRDNTVTRIDPSSGKVLGTPIRFGGGNQPVTGGPGGIAAGLGGVWVTHPNEKTVSRIDPSSGRVVGTIKVGNAGDVATGEGGVWVADVPDRGPGDVTRIDPRSGKVVGKPIKVGPDPGSIAAGEGGVWVADRIDSTIRRIDPSSDRVVQTINVAAITAAPNHVTLPRIAIGDGWIWVTDSAYSGFVIRIAPRSGNVVGSPIKVGCGADWIAVGPGGVWVVNLGDFSISRINPSSDKVLGNAITLPTLPKTSGCNGAQPNSIYPVAVGQDVWVALATTNSVIRIRP